MDEPTKACPVCHAKNLGEARFCVACGSPLGRLCSSCGSGLPDEARFCPTCGSAVSEAEKREIRRVVTVLFNDIVGSTALGEQLDPESLRQVIFRYFAGMQAVIERLGGTVPQFMGDAVMGVFGIPTAHEDDSLRAVQAAWQMQSELTSLNESLETDWGVRLATRTGINTGRVVIGSPVGAQGIVVGDAVNIAARLQSAAAPEEILIGDGTYRFVKEAVKVGEPRELELRGKTQTVTAWPLLEVAKVPVPRRRQLAAALVGRARERLVLQNIFDQTLLERQCQLVTVVGDPGVGKTRLIEELTEGNSDRARVLRGRCLPYGDGITYWPMLEIVQQGADVTSDDDRDEARAKIARFVESESDGAVIADVVAQVVGLSHPTSTTEQIFWALRRWLEAVANDQPLWLVVDDIQWAEPNFLAFLEHMADRIQEFPILLVCMARLEFLDARPDWVKHNAAVLSLRPLTDAESGALLDSLSESANLDPDIRSFVLGAAEGNPLFLEELLLMLFEEGHLRRDDGRWTANVDLSKLSIPPNIHALLTARLDSLGVEERQVVETAAVMGAHFSARAVADLVPTEMQMNAESNLAALARKEILKTLDERVADAPTFRFRHLLIRDAAYDGMSKEARARLHQAYADWLLEAMAGREQEYGEIIAHHLERAYRLRVELGRGSAEIESVASAAFESLQFAAERALGRGDLSAGLKFLERAADLWPPHDRRRVRLLPRIGDTLVFAGRFAEADRLLEEALELAEALNETDVAAHARVTRATLHQVHTQASNITEREVLEIAENAMKTLEQSGNDRALAAVGYGLAYALLVQGRLADSEREFRRAIEHARAAGQVSVEAAARRTMLVAIQMGVAPATQVIEEAEANLEWARNAGERLLEARALGVMGVGLAMTRRFEEAGRKGQESREILSDLGSKLRLAYGAFEGGEIHMLRGDQIAAEKILREGHDLIEELGDIGVRSSIAALLADALYVQSKLDEADSFAQLSESISDPMDVLSHATSRRVRAKIYARRGEVDAAVETAERAVAIARTADFLTVRALAISDLAEVLALTGRQSPARAALDEALEFYMVRENWAGAERARQTVGELLD